MTYLLLILFVCFMQLCAFEMSLNPFEQLRLAEKNRRTLVNSLSGLTIKRRAKLPEEGQEKESQQKVNGDFATIAGSMPPEIIELRNYLENPNYYKDSGLTPPKGFLLVGPTGTGKTSIVRALAQETGCKLLNTSASSWGCIYVGTGMKEVRELFENARYEASLSTERPVVIFIDEIDAIGNRNEGRSDRQTITALLNEMDGFEQNNNLIVIAATNHPEVLDPALKRPGRFDRIIEIGPPSEENRKEILLFNLSNVRLDKTVNIEELAQMTINFVPADLKSLTDRAKEKAFHDGKRAITQNDLIEAAKNVAQNISVRQSSQQKLKKVEKQGMHGFTDLAGEIDQELLDLREYLVNPERFKKLGIKCPKGVLLVGPPGTGKTSLARALANETDCDFINKSASEFMEMFVGVGPQRVRELFEEARKRAQNNGAKKTIIFIDDLDAIGARSGQHGDSGETQRTITELLNQMDGFDQSENILVMGATNHPGNIDDALVRPGRFDIIIEVPLPDIKKREAILQKTCLDKPLAVDVVMKELAELTAGTSPAELNNMINQAAKFALRDGSDKITKAHFVAAIQQMKTSRTMKRRHFANLGE